MKKARSSPQAPLLKDRLFRTGLVSTTLALAACLATHLVTLFGVVGAMAWLGSLEHALVVAVVGLAGLTAYAAYRHRRCTGHGPGAQRNCGQS